MWWRILVPTWRFFDQVAETPRLSVRTGGTWREIGTPPPRRWFHLVYNPHGNLWHARNNLLQRLLEEAQATETIGELASYKITEQMARDEARAGHPQATFFEFKITLAGEDVFMSSSCPL